MNISCICLSNYYKTDISFKLLDSNYDRSKIKIVKDVSRKRGYSVLIQDKDKNLFVIKQTILSSGEKRLLPVREALCAYIAQSVQIPANHVRIIPANCSFPGKKYTNLPASIHAIVPGEPVSRLPRIRNPFFNLKQ